MTYFEKSTKDLVAFFASYIHTCIQMLLQMFLMPRPLLLLYVMQKQKKKDEQIKGRKVNKLNVGKNEQIKNRKELAI